MIRKLTALLKTKQWFKHPRLEQISISVDACAISGAISRFESGNHNPSLAFLQRIAEGLGKKIYVEFR